MYLYVHEYKNKEDSRIKEIRDILFNRCYEDYIKRISIDKSVDDKTNLVEPHTAAQMPEIVLNKHGRPYFKDREDLFFSISHSGRFWAVLFSEENVGFDIEDLSIRDISLKRYTGIMKRFFSEEEYNFVMNDLNEIDMETELNIDLDELQKRFFRVWTGKEAYFKFTGKGFVQGFKTFSVLDTKGEFYLDMVPVDTDVIATICTSSKKKLKGLITV